MCFADALAETGGCALFFAVALAGTAGGAFFLALMDLASLPSFIGEGTRWPDTE